MYLSLSLHPQTEAHGWRVVVNLLGQTIRDWFDPPLVSQLILGDCACQIFQVIDNTMFTISFPSNVSLVSENIFPIYKVINVAGNF